MPLGHLTGYVSVNGDVKCEHPASYSATRDKFGDQLDEYFLFSWSRELGCLPEVTDQDGDDEFNREELQNATQILQEKYGTADALFEHLKPIWMANGHIWLREDDSSTQLPEEITGDFIVESDSGVTRTVELVKHIKGSIVVVGTGIILMKDLLTTGGGLTLLYDQVLTAPELQETGYLRLHDEAAFLAGKLTKVREDVYATHGTALRVPKLTDIDGELGIAGDQQLESLTVVRKGVTVQSGHLETPKITTVIEGIHLCRSAIMDAFSLEQAGWLRLDENSRLNAPLLRKVFPCGIKVTGTTFDAPALRDMDRACGSITLCRGARMTAPLLERVPGKVELVYSYLKALCLYEAGALMISGEGCPVVIKGKIPKTKYLTAPRLCIAVDNPVTLETTFSMSIVDQYASTC